MHADTNKANIFGDGRAENDKKMLDLAFYEWQDYKTLQESNDRFIVVGRRGTGKSALTYQLEREWRAKKEITIVIAPSEEEIIGLRIAANLFGSTVSRIRAGVKMAWKYAILMEIALRLSINYKTKDALPSYETTFSHLKLWKQSGDSIIERLRQRLKIDIRPLESSEERITEISRIFALTRISSELLELISTGEKIVSILIDRLDEGYEPDPVGIGIVDGIIYGMDDIRSNFNGKIRGIIFLRDNIFRAIEEADNDFSRNIEGQVLRLHWDPVELLHLITKRIRYALSIEQESDIKVWNRYVTDDLRGIEGFKKCLKLTLYRPRDLLTLLNQSHLTAKKQDRINLMLSDVESSAKQISVTRFDDLSKEYSSVFPGIRVFINAFAGGTRKLSFQSADEIIQRLLVAENLTPGEIQFERILGGSAEIVKALYGVGFFGVIEEGTDRFIFSHDGKRPNRNYAPTSTLLIHPCYWAALNLSKTDYEISLTDDIFDEYEISISSESKEIRERKLGQMISELNEIGIGSEGASLFEDWCKRTIEIAFPKNLTNIQLHPNKSHVQRRDVVATNQGITGVWKRIREDYTVRQVIFEVKNYEKLSIDEYRQVSSYLGREYGSLAFIICRDSIPELTKERDLEPFREFYSFKNHVIVKLTAKQMSSILSKLRSPQKNDDVDRILDKHLDNHIRLYAIGQDGQTSKRRKR